MELDEILLFFLESIDEKVISNVETLLYKAPEISTTSGGYTNKVDIWSIGICGYEMVSLMKPFNDNPEVIQYFFGKHKYQKLSKENNPFLVNIVNKMLKAQPADRPSADELLQVMSELCKHNEIIINCNVCMHKFCSISSFPLLFCPLKICKWFSHLKHHRFNVYYF